MEGLGLQEEGNELELVGWVGFGRASFNPRGVL